MNQPSDLSNRGITYVNRPTTSPAMAGLRPPRTYILTGLACSGTSMLAQALRAAGIFIGAAADHIVHEDVEIGQALQNRDMAALGRIIHNRNTAHQVWAFKRPDLHEVAGPETIEAFRNPHLVVTFRDAAAVAQRNVMSEKRDGWAMFEAAARGQLALTAFLRQLKCPMMLVSYEKALAFPEHFVEALGEFLGQPGPVSQKMRGAVEPDRGEYIRAYRRQFQGAIDYVADGILSGWARDVASPVPVPLTLLLDDQPVLNFAADQMRPDLAALGFGGGRHGFAVSVRAFLHRPHAIARVQITGRTFELEKSGKPLAQLIAR
jgi:hypothetical protein